MAADTPTLSPAARERLDAAMRDLERAASDLFWPYNREPARAALTATVAALVAEAEACGREAAGDLLRTAFSEGLTPDETEELRQACDALAARYPNAPDDVQRLRKSFAHLVGALRQARGEAREAAGLWRCECPMCLHHTEAHAINDPPPADFHGVTAPPHAAWCQSRHYHAPAAPLPCNCAGLPTPTEGDPR